MIDVKPIFFLPLKVPINEAIKIIIIIKERKKELNEQGTASYPGYVNKVHAM
jgi:hypothetical protein